MWQRFMVKYILDRYMANRAYYMLNTNSGRSCNADNPDARMEYDVQETVQDATSLVTDVLNMVQGVLSCAVIVWMLAPWWIGGAVCYTLCGSVVGICFSWRLMRLNYEVERRSADFRFSLVNVRNHAEPIALHGGEKREQVTINEKFDAELEFSWRRIIWSTLWNVWRTIYLFGINTAPQLIMVRKYFSGHMDFGSVYQGMNAFKGLSHHLDFLSNDTERLARLGTCITRLANLLQEFERFSEPPEIETVVSRDGCVEVTDLSVKTPETNLIVVSELSLSLGGAGAPQRLLVVGRSGVGKSSLVRALAGVWVRGSGRISRPHSLEIMFLPQQPYMPLGTLREQLRYPNMRHRPCPLSPADLAKGVTSHKGLNPQDDSEELQALLRSVGLGELQGRFEDGLNHVEDWQRFLSLGEQQRVAAIRCLLRHPKLVVLDEATSALSELDEAVVYQRMLEMKIPYISVGHRISMVKYHDHILELRGGHDHQLFTPKEYLLHRSQTAPKTPWDLTT